MALELVHGKPGQRGFEVLDLSISSWKLIIELATKNGWSPPKDAACNFSEWYYWDHPAQVSRKEAQLISAALKRALETPELRDATLPASLRSFKDAPDAVLVDSNYSRFCGLSREMVERVVKFFDRGGFQYAVWD
jgi:hypothetical protein